MREWERPLHPVYKNMLSLWLIQHNPNMSKEAESASMSTILIVDDDPHLRELSGVFLQREGFDVAFAANGREALSFLENRKVDLVILDIMLPDMGGLDVLQHIRRNVTTADLRVAILSAKDLSEIERNRLDRAVFWQKGTLDKDKLLEAVEAQFA